MRFQRNYQIKIQTPDRTTIEINPPFTARFEVSRNTQNSPNTCNVTIVNLKESTRAQIFKDRFTFSEYWQMIVLAGYGSDLFEIFRGNIYEAYSYKSGNEWVTSIEGQDGLFSVQNGITSRTVEAGTDKRNIVEQVISDMPNLITGFISPEINGTSERGTVLYGRSADIVADLSEGRNFIDGERLNILGVNEAFGDVLVLDSSIRFNTPRRREAIMEVSTLFTPNIRLGQFVEIRDGEKVYSGQYKVIGIKHSLTVSQAEGGSAQTDLMLDAGTQALKAVLR